MILRDERNGAELTVPPEGVRLGRDPTLEMVFTENDDVVSALHCRVVRHDDETWWLEDLGSTNGTWLSGHRLTEPVRLTSGMKFSLGQRGPVIKASIPGEVARTQAEPAVNLGLPTVRLRRVKGGEDLVGAGVEVVMGRSAACQISLRTIADTVVSKRHASISFDVGHAWLNDLGSRNGTYLNGNAVQTRTRLRPGDRIMLGWQGPMFEVRTVGSQSLGDHEGAPYEPDREPRKSFGGMMAVAEVEAKSAPKSRTGVFMKAMARQIATESSPGFRVAVVVAFVALILAVGLLWQQSIKRNAVAESRLKNAERAFSEQIRRADSAQQVSTARIAALSVELETARANAVSRSVLDSLERRLREQESLATVGGTAPQPAAPMTTVDFTGVARDNGRAVGLVIVRFASDSVMGSGFAITPTGYFVTNRHVVVADGRESPRQVLVVMAESNVGLPADVVSVSSIQSQDVAVLKIRGYRGPTVRAIDWAGRGAQQGAQAAMLGFPFGTSLAMDQSGNIRSTIFGGLIAQTGDWIRFSGSTYAGVSGSPLFNTAGEVIAVHFGAPREGTGLGISVPMSKVRRWLPAEAKSELGL